MSAAVQVSPWARGRRQEALTATLRSIPANDLRYMLARAICEVYGIRFAKTLALDLPLEVQDAIEEGAADA